MSELIVRGRAWKFGDNIDTDIIIPSKYYLGRDPELWAKHIMEPIRPDFPEKVRKGDIVVAGRNFGCGSARDAASALKYAGIEAVVSESIARTFYRNSINIGMIPIICKGAYQEIGEGDELEIDLTRGEIVDATTGRIFKFEPFPTLVMQILRKSGIIGFLKDWLKAQG